MTMLFKIGTTVYSTIAVKSVRGYRVSTEDRVRVTFLDGSYKEVGNFWPEGREEFEHICRIFLIDYYTLQPLIGGDT